MFKSYFLVAIRGFWRNKTFSLINILGLSIGISASLIIFLLVDYDFTFDKFEKNADRIYRVVADTKSNGESSHTNALPVPMGSAIQKDLTGIELAASFRTDERRVTIPYPDANHPLVLKKQKDLVFADDHYFNLIDYTWLSGSPATALKEPYQVVLTEKNARRYYPGLHNADIIGRSIAFDDTILATITGIVKDIAANTDFNFGTFISRSTLYTNRLQPSEFSEWNSTNSANQLFVRLSPGTKPATVNPQLDRLLYKYDPPNPNHSSIHCRLQPLADLHFNPDLEIFDQSRQPHKPTLYGLLAVASFLLLLACINFINLTTAQSSQRAKEIGIRKTMGGYRRQLALQFLAETFLLTLIATILSLALTPSLLQVFADFIPEDFHISLIRQPEIIGFLLTLIAAVSLLSGLYPAFVLSGYDPVLVMKNQAGANMTQTRSAWLRKTLTVSQFVIAQVFIIGTLLVSKQISYALHKDLGFKKDAILTFRTNHFHPAQKRTLLLDKLTAIPGIMLISQSSNPPSNSSTWTSTMTYKDGKKEIRQNVEVKLADSNYFKIYRFRLLAGVSIPQSDTTNAVVVNETYAHILGFQNPQDVIGKQLDWNGNPHIVGVVADFHQHSLHGSIKPIVIANGTRDATTFNIALPPQNTAAWPKTIASIAGAFRSVYPNDDFDYQFVDETIAKFYTAEKNIARLLAWATGLTIFISCLGLLGLVIYITNQRTKEIGIRKVIGATVIQLIVLLSRDFLKLIGLAIVIAIPIAWWGSRRWLENFNYRTQLSWWLFAAGGGALLIIALAILCLRTFKAAARNPIDSLRTE